MNVPNIENPNVAKAYEKAKKDFPDLKTWFVRYPAFVEEIKDGQKYNSCGIIYTRISDKKWPIAPSWDVKWIGLSDSGKWDKDFYEWQILIK